MPNLVSLGPKLLPKILVQLSVHDLLTFKRVSRFFLNLINETVEINYRIQLELSGMIDNGRCSMPISERMRYLGLREDAWGFFKSNVTAELHPHSSRSSTRVICDATASEIFVGLVPDGSDDNDSFGVEHIRLPSVFNEEQGENGEGGWGWTRRMTSMRAPVIGFGASVEENDLFAFALFSQDDEDDSMFNLLIALTRSSTHTLHDESESPVFRVGRYHASLGRPTVTLALAGENLAVAAVYPDNRMGDRNFLRILNWRTADPKGAQFRATDASLVFLREDLLLTANSLRGSLDIYQIPSTAALALNPPPPQAEEYNPLSALPSYLPPLRVRVIHAFQLPPLASGWSTTSIQCYSSPSPTANGAFPATMPVSRPYTQDPAQALVALTMNIVQDANPSTKKAFQMVVHRSSLLNGLPSAKLLEFELMIERLKIRKEAASDVSQAFENLGLRSDSEAYTTSVFYAFQSWEEWGPSVTRWFDATGLSRRFAGVVSGQHYVQYNRDESFAEVGNGEGGGKGTVHVMEFNQWTVKRAWNGFKSPRLFKGPLFAISVVGMAAKEDNSDGAEAQENICPSNGVFESELVGRLPYVRCTKNEKMNYESVFLCEQSLIGLSMQAGSNKAESISVVFFG